MSPIPRHGTMSGDATLALRRIARRNGTDVQELLTLYALEGLLARIGSSPYRDDLVLKGGVLLAAFAARRPTKDIDLRATRLSGDLDEVADRIRAIAVLPLPDGLEFDAASVTATSIRDEEDYSGVRVRLSAALAAARLRVGVDVSFGDPINPEPELIDLPRLVPLGLPPVSVLGYPLTMVLAEKIVTAVDRGQANTRWRDFADVYTLSRLHRIPAAELRASMETVSTHRGVTLVPLLPGLAPMNDRAQGRYAAWRDRSNREAELPATFADLLAAVASFGDPVLRASTPRGRWNCEAGVWE